MLAINRVSKTFGSEPILKEISFVVNRGERWGLIGPNGCGKTTLLRIIAGEQQPDGGEITTAPDTVIAYLPQGLPLDEQVTVKETIRGGMPEWESARKKFQQYARLVAETGEGARRESHLAKYGQALTRFEALGGFAVESRFESVLQGLGFPSERIEESIANLSGGERTRIGLAKVLIRQPDLLLLDEPTNHLDIDALEWLESFLAKYDGAVLLVSHDRVFLDNSVNRIAAIDPTDQHASLYTGGYSDYAKTAAGELARTWEAWHIQQGDIRRMRQDIHKTKMQARSVEQTTTSRQPNVRRYAKKVAKKAKSREKKLDRYLQSDERVEKPKKGWQLDLNLEHGSRSGKRVLVLENISHRYPGGPKLFAGLKAEVLSGERIALLGPNGGGKSTLIKIVIGQIQPDKGSVQRGAGVRLGYMPQEQETLDPHATALSIVQDAAGINETEARNFLHHFLFSGDGALRPVEQLSYGERARIIMARLVISGANFLVLDEPLNHLDIQSRQRFEAALDAFPGTVLAVSHDRAFIHHFAQKIWRIREGGLAIDVV
jgi:ATP-binding cassette subfamily F protein 3